MTTVNPEALGVEVQPDDRYFDIMAEVSETHWWYRARRAWLRQELGPRMATGERAYDVGCGTGDAMATLTELGATAVAGTDLSSHVLLRLPADGNFVLDRDQSQRADCGRRPQRERERDQDFAAKHTS